MRKATRWLALMGAAAICWLTLAPTQLGGPVTLAVVSGISMQPALQDGDLVIAYRQSEYELGDTVIYDKLGGIVIHEIYAEVSDAAKPVGSSTAPEFKTRGINNKYADSWRVYASDIRGRMVLVVPKAGAALVALTSNPLFASVAATGLAAFVLLPKPRPKLSQELLAVLAHSATERRRIKRPVAIEFTWLAVLTVATTLSSALLLVKQVPLWPQVGLSLLALIVATALLVWFWTYHATGRDLAEPQRSMAVLGPRLHRIAPDITLDAVPVASADELANIRARTGLPVLHQIVDVVREEPNATVQATHRFFVMTEKQTYVWSVTVLQAEEYHE